MNFTKLGKFLGNVTAVIVFAVLAVALGSLAIKGIWWIWTGEW